MSKIAHTQLPEAMRPVNVGRRLAQLREASGKSKSDVCRELGIDPSAYTKYEKGVRALPVHLAYRLAVLLGGDLNFLLAGDPGRLPLEVARRMGIA